MECKNFSQKFEDIAGWEKTNDGREAYFKLFKFSDFKEAFSFMTSIAIKAKQINYARWAFYAKSYSCLACSKYNIKF